jgi:DHA1 family tetracycline resistance protein-like MFS transporter
MSANIVTTTQGEVQEKLNFKKILPVFVIVLIDLLGLTIIIPLMPLYATAYGADALIIGLLGASYPAFQFIGAPLLGRLSDRFGRKPILIISQIGTLMGFLILGFANSVWMLFLARILDGISGANISTAQAAISDSTTEKTRTQGLGLIGAAFGLGFILGPIIAFVALTASGNNYHVSAFVAAAFSFLSILLTWFWFEETLPEELRGTTKRQPAFTLSAMLKALKNPAVGLLLVLMFSQQIAFGGFEQLLALFTLNRLGLNASGNAGIFVFVGIIVVAVQGGLIGRWSRKYGDRRLVLVGLTTLALGLILTALTPRQPLPTYSREKLLAELSGSAEFRTHENPTTRNLTIDIPDDTDKGWMGMGWLLLAMIPAAVGGGILQPSINSLITQRVAKDEVGGMLGISAAFLSGSNAIAPLLGGAIFQMLGATAPFLLGGILLGLLWLVTLYMLR